MKKQEKLFKQAQKGDDRSIIELTLLIQHNKIESSVAKQILGNMDKENLPIRYLEACLYAYGAEVGDRNPKKAFEILNPLINEHHYAYALAVAGVMFSEENTRGVYSNSGFYEEKKPTEDYTLLARNYGNPLAIFNYLNTHTFEEYREWFQAATIIFDKLPGSLQNELKKRIAELEDRLVKNGQTSDKDAWVNLAKYYQNAGPGYEPKLAKALLYAAKYGDIEMTMLMLKPMKDLNLNQQLALITRLNDSVNLYKDFLKKISYQGLSNELLLKKVEKIQQDSESLGVELSTIMLLTQLYPKNKDKLSGELEACKRNYEEYGRLAQEKINEITAELLRQAKVAEDRGLVSEGEKKLLDSLALTTGLYGADKGSILFHLENSKMRTAQLREDVENISQLSKVMTHTMINRLIELNEEIDNILRIASKPTFSLLNYFGQSTPQEKSVKNELDEELLSLLNLPKIDLKKSDLGYDLSKRLDDDCKMIDRWLEHREQGLKGKPNEEFTKAKEEVLAIRDNIAQMRENLNPQPKRASWEK